MQYTLETDASATTSTLVLSGTLTIAHSQSLHQLLLQPRQPGQTLQLRLREVEALDLSFVQLLLAATQPPSDKQPAWQLHMDLPPQLAQLLQLAGLDIPNA